jgi:outer membrane protein assembly factor BamB
MRIQFGKLLLNSVVTALAALPFTVPAFGQISSSEAQRLGMEAVWQAQLQLPLAGRGIASTHVWSDPVNSRQFAVVELPDRTIRIAADTPDRKGNAIGIAEAKKQANAYAARLLGKQDGFQVVEVTVPDQKLVVVTADGIVQTIDAESGAILWKTSLGNLRAPSHPATISSAGISLIHGENLFLVGWDGKIKNTTHLQSATSNAVAVCQDVTFVGDFKGQITVYGLESNVKPQRYSIQGRAVGRPVSTTAPDFSAFASDEGYVYIFTVRETPSIWIRYQAPGTMTGSLAVGNGAFYAGSTIGTLAKISTEDRVGKIEWDYRAGESIEAPAFVAGTHVFVPTDAGNLIAIDDATGYAAWILDGLRAKTIIGRASNKVFFTTTSGELSAVDIASGQRVATTSTMELSAPVVNPVSDRIFIISKSGSIQCLRPIGAVLPSFITPPIIVEKTEAEATTSEAMETETGDGVSPFEAFGTESAAPEGNPFGDGDPFGGGVGGNAGDAPGENPFGGDDPFK